MRKTVRIMTKVVVIVMLATMMHCQCRWYHDDNAIVQKVKESVATYENTTTKSVLDSLFGKHAEIFWAVEPLHVNVMVGVEDAVVVAVVMSECIGTSHPVFRWYWSRDGIVALTPKTAACFPKTSPPKGTGLDPYGLSYYAF